MAEFTLHIRLEADRAEPEDGTRLLEPFTDREGVTFGTVRIEANEPGVLAPEQGSLEIEDIEAFAAVYDDLRTEPEIHDINLWGPSAERYPVPVQHYALQQIQRPTLYEYHALDDQVTLVVAESEMAADQLRREVPDAALGYSDSPF
jgi:hypothetical protein